MRYGLPYQGSKNAIARQIVEVLPPGETFVDLFAGGCAITHAAMLSHKYKRFICNDISDVPQLFLDAVNGRNHNETRWISREDFFRLKDTEPYIRYCWSFGNSGGNYLYSKEIEPWKKSLHYARVLGDISLLAEFGIDSDGSRKDIVAHHGAYKQKYIRWWLSQQEYMAEELNTLIERCKGQIAVQEEELRQYLLDALKDSGLTQAEVQRRLGTQMAGHYFGRSQWQFPTQEMYERMQAFMPALSQDYNEVIGLHNLWQRLERLQSLERLERLEGLQSLQSLERLERLERLQRLESLQRLETYQLDYQQVEIPEGAVVYCDIPYIGTAGYNGTGFDHEAFYEWADTRGYPVFVSEYTMPSDRFTPIYKIGKNALMSAQGVTKKMTECVFTQKRYADRYKYGLFGW